MIPGMLVGLPEMVGAPRVGGDKTYTDMQKDVLMSFCISALGDGFTALKTTKKGEPLKVRP